MGITFIQKSTPENRPENPQIALVLAGGAVTGGAFKLGGLVALDDLLSRRKIVDFDIYVGLSAGALLAAPLAAGIPPAQLMAALGGEGELAEFRLRDFYRPNLAELVTKPIEFVTDLISYLPGALAEVLLRSPTTYRRLQEPLQACASAPSRDALERLTTEVLRGLRTHRSFPFALDYLPAGAFDNAGIERFLRRGFAARGISNNFDTLLRERGKKLYVAAVNLDSAERVVFGPQQEELLSISEAVQASTAMPGFYKPARLRGIDYVDGGVRRTANIDVAIEHGANLVLAYNPFRPFNNRPRMRGGRLVDGSTLSDRGLFAVMNQVFRAMLHSRLHLGLQQYREDPRFQGDILLIEPGDSDETFFRMFPLDFTARQKAAKHGYASVARSIAEHRETLTKVLKPYRVELHESPTGEGFSQILGEEAKRPRAVKS
jgi:NTE family protein